MERYVKLRDDERERLMDLVKLNLNANESQGHLADQEDLKALLIKLLEAVPEQELREMLVKTGLESFWGPLG